jgi:hypothetical protein
MGNDDTDREQGVDFTDIDPVLEDISYPITADDLVDQYGDQEVERTNADPISLRELFDHMGDDTFESKEELRQMMMSQMPRDSVGRANYSDRGGEQPTETDESENVDETDTDLSE